MSLIYDVDNFDSVGREIFKIQNPMFYSNLTLAQFRIILLKQCFEILISKLAILNSLPFLFATSRERSFQDKNFA